MMMKNVQSITAALLVSFSIIFAPVQWFFGLNHEIKIFAPALRLFALNHETKQCAGYWAGDEFVNYELPVGWKTFEYQLSKDTMSIETDIGTCRVPWMGQIKSEEACCSQLGYTYIAENIGLREALPLPGSLNSINQEQPGDYILATLVGVVSFTSVVALGLWLYHKISK